MRLKLNAVLLGAEFYNSCFRFPRKAPPKNSTCQLLCMTHQLTGGRKSPGRSMLCCNRATKFLIYRVPLH